VALSTGELQKLIPELIEALGGEVAFGEMPIGTVGGTASEPSGTGRPHGEAVTAVGEGEAPF
jgi:recombination associated protein RdgC